MENLINDQHNDIKIISTKTHLDHVFIYSGQNYGCCESSALHALNELSRNNYLQLHQRQITNRDVRILLPANNLQRINSLKQQQQQYQQTPRSCPKFSKNKSTSYFNEPCYGDYDNNNKNCYMEKGDEENNYKQHMISSAYRMLENKNYQIFLENFNKISLACYLKLMRASRDVWSSYDLEDPKIIDHTNFYITKQGGDSNSNNESRALQKNLNDEEFIRQYVDLIVLVHNQIVSKLHHMLNCPPMRVHFVNSSKSSGASKNSKNTDCHLFRSFRILGLRQEKTKGKQACYNNNTNHFCESACSSTNVKIINNPNFMENNNSNFTSSKTESYTSSSFRDPLVSPTNQFDPKNNFLLKNNFNEIVDIRGAFDIRQFENKCGYDCFIECEMNYYKVLNDKFKTHNVNQTRQSSFNNFSNKNTTSCDNSRYKEPHFNSSAHQPQQQYQNQAFYKQNLNDFNYFKKIFNNINCSDSSSSISSGNNSEIEAEDESSIYCNNDYYYYKHHNNYNNNLNNNYSSHYPNINKTEQNCRPNLRNQSYSHQNNQQKKSNKNFLSNNNNNNNYANHEHGKTDMPNGHMLANEKFLNKTLMNRNNCAFKYTDEDLKNVLFHQNQSNSKMNANKNNASSNYKSNSRCFRRNVENDIYNLNKYANNSSNGGGGSINSGGASRVHDGVGVTRNGSYSYTFRCNNTSNSRNNSRNRFKV